jgi:hypothetical protein
MATLTFKPDSEPYTIYEHFMAGGSLTHDEAHDGKCGKKIRHIAQRLNDIKKKFDKAKAVFPLMYIDEPNERGGIHRRYFYRGFGCSYENHPGAKAYGE